MTQFFIAIKIAFQYMYRNFGLSFASVVVMTLSFFIVSVVGIAFYASYELVRYVDSKPALVIFLRGDLNEEQGKEFAEIVNKSGLAREFSVKDIDYTTEDFSKNYPDPELKESISKDENKKFLPRVTFVYGNTQNDLEKLIELLRNNENFMTNIVDTKNIDKVGWYSFDQNQAVVIKDANRLITVAGGIVTIILFVISAILIFITVKLTINYHRRELEIMDLVGAEGWFIRLPFVFSGIIYGVLGAALSTTMIFLFKNLVLETSQSLIPKLSQFFIEVRWPDLNDPKLIFELFLITMAIGAVVGALSSFFAILKYVKK